MRDPARHDIADATRWRRSSCNSNESPKEAIVTEGKLNEIYQHELEERRRFGVYLLGLTTAVLVVLAAIAMAGH